MTANQVDFLNEIDDTYLDWKFYKQQMPAIRKPALNINKQFTRQNSFQKNTSVASNIASNLTKVNLVTNKKGYQDNQNQAIQTGMLIKHDKFGKEKSFVLMG